VQFFSSRLNSSFNGVEISVTLCIAPVPVACIVRRPPISCAPRMSVIVFVIMCIVCIFMHLAKTNSIGICTVGLCVICAFCYCILSILMLIAVCNNCVYVCDVVV